VNHRIIVKVLIQGYYFTTSDEEDLPTQTVSLPIPVVLKALLADLCEAELFNVSMID